MKSPVASRLITNTCIGKGEEDVHLQTEARAAPSSVALSDPTARACCAVRPEMGQSSGGSLAAPQLSESLVPTRSPLPPACALQ